MGLAIVAALLVLGALCAFAGVGLLRAERRFGPEPNRGLAGRAFVAMGVLFAGLGVLLALALLLI